MAPLLEVIPALPPQVLALPPPAHAMDGDLALPALMAEEVLPMDIALPVPQVIPLAPVEVVAQVILPGLDEPAPRHSSRLAEQTNGMYVNVLEKALKKKKMDDSPISAASRTSKNSRESENGRGTSAPPPLTIEQLVCLGRESGFDDKEEGELIGAANGETHVE
jgi:hypothetical protein